jgi:hypothetical protein
VRLVYRAYLFGTTAINYNPTFKDHHFFALDIGQVMAAGGIANTQTITEDIEIGYYANSQIELRDPVSSERQAVFSAQVRAA